MGRQDVDEDLGLGPALRRRGPGPDRRIGQSVPRTDEGRGNQMIASTPLLRVSDIEVVYDGVIQVLRGVSLVVQTGGAVALLGANGAGKSTTLKAISNLLLS